MKENIRRETNEKMAKSYWKDFEKSPMFVNLFDDMELATKQSLKNMKTHLESMRDSMIAAGLPASDLKEILDISGVQPIDTTGLGTDYSLKVDGRLVEESKKKNSPVYHLISKNPDSGTFWIYLPEFNGEKGVCFSIGYRDKLDFFLAATYYITPDGKKGIRDTNFRNTLVEFRDMLKQLITK
jgi:hypothetical protein